MPASPSSDDPNMCQPAQTSCERAHKAWTPASSEYAAITETRRPGSSERRWMGANKRPAGHCQCVLTFLSFLGFLWPGAYCDAPGPPLGFVCSRWPGAYCDAPGPLVGFCCSWWPGENVEAPPPPDLPPACATVASVALANNNVAITAVREILMTSPRIGFTTVGNGEIALENRQNCDKSLNLRHPLVSDTSVQHYVRCMMAWGPRSR